MLGFYEQPQAVYYASSSTPAHLKCQLENARTGFFKCNKDSTRSSSSSSFVQIGNRQLLVIEQVVAAEELTTDYWCVCQGSSGDETLTSGRVDVRLATLDDAFEWEPMATSGLIG